MTLKIARLLGGRPERDGPAGAAAAEGRGAPRLRALLAQAASFVKAPCKRQGAPLRRASAVSANSDQQQRCMPSLAPLRHQSNVTLLR